MTTTVAILGRPNVGKSTLFNRLVGRRLALVHDEPGVTRDRREGEARLDDLAFTVIDTAGITEGRADEIAEITRAQTRNVIAASDIALFVVDARSGVTGGDEQLADLVRKSGTPVLLVANKCEGARARAGVYEAYMLGLGEPVAISAEHGEGMDDLADALRPLIEAAAREAPGAEAPRLPAQMGEEEEEAAMAGPDRPLRVAIVGRPNTGKSTLVNRLIGEERLVTSPEAGTTRDAIAIDWRWREQPVKLFDTAGLRRRARIVEPVERLSVGDALKAIRFAEIVVLTVDATQPFEKQDLQIADLIEREGRAAVIALTKWDLVAEPGETLRSLRREAARLLPQLRGVPVIALSARTGAGLHRLMPAVMKVYDRWNRRIGTGPLNRWLRQALEHHPPPAPGGRRLRIRYLTQAKARPPTFVAFCTRPKELPAAYVRYLVNGLREAFDLDAVPIRLVLRKGENPYAR